MSGLKDLFQSADWKKEKHSPVIEVSGKAKKAEPLEVAVSIGKEIPHPNTSVHHISWIEVYFLPENEKFPYQIGRFEFTSHGASVQGPDTSTIYTEPKVKFFFKTEKPGQIMAVSYCNIHGLWESTQDLQVE
ncbi:MAG: class II SORL domain-containing protein [Candidatus Omnitrophica bacterium]|nr:class II SORL domain-containing protein [Candidatus Omnitrophota bacterium]